MTLKPLPADQREELVTKLDSAQKNGVITSNEHYLVRLWFLEHDMHVQQAIELRDNWAKREVRAHEIIERTESINYEPTTT